MGSEFFYFLDLFVIAIVAASIFRGVKRGAVAVLISSVAAILAFLLAFACCTPVSKAIYDRFISEKVEENIRSRLGSTLDTELIKGLGEVDMMKTRTSSGYLSDIPIEYNERGNAMIDLSAADLTETKIQNIDLSGFGIKKDFDWSLVKAGHIQVSSQDVNKYGLGNVVLAKIITTEMTSGSVLNALSDIGKKLGETISPSLRTLGDDLGDGSRDAVYNFVVSMITISDGSIGDRVMTDIVEPTVMIPLKALVFCIIFAIVVALLSIIANASKVINKIPIVSGVNEFFGGVLGFLEAAVTLIIVCVLLRFLISVCGDSLVFLNENTIDKIYLFLRSTVAFRGIEIIQKKGNRNYGYDVFKMP